MVAHEMFFTEWAPLRKAVAAVRPALVARRAARGGRRRWVADDGPLWAGTS